MKATDMEHFIGLKDTAEWTDFWSANEQALSEIGSEETCFRLACNCELVVGGGASPLFRIGFVDGDEQ